MELAEAGLSGAEAYGRYGAIPLGHVLRRIGELMLHNDVSQVLIGQTGRWARYQSPGTSFFVWLR
ncbi:MAG: hypothetical protein ACLQRH_13155 [Acidimicrobiales bacterium]